MELFLEPSGDSLFPLPKRTIKSQRTRTYTRTYNYEKLKRDLSSWRIYGGGSAMFVSARIVFSEKTRLPSKWWWAWREDGWKGGNWINRGIVKSVGSHRIVVTVKRSRLTTHGDCLTSSRLDWSWPAALCCTAPVHPPKMHSTVVKAATLVPHARFSQFEFALPFPCAHATNQLHTNARLVRGELDSFFSKSR